MLFAVTKNITKNIVKHIVKNIQRKQMVSNPAPESNKVHRDLRTTYAPFFLFFFTEHLFLGYPGICQQDNAKQHSAHIKRA